MKTITYDKSSRASRVASHSDLSLIFDKPKSGRIAVKVISHLGDGVMKVHKVGGANDCSS